MTSSDRIIVEALRCAADACSYRADGTYATWTKWGGAVGIAARHFDISPAIMTQRSMRVNVDILDATCAEEKRMLLLEAARRIEEGWRP